MVVNGLRPRQHAIDRTEPFDVSRSVGGAVDASLAGEGSAMKAKLIHDGPQKTFVAVFDKGDDVVQGLGTLAEEFGFAASEFRGIGAFSDVVLGYFDRKTKEYQRIPVEEQVEVLSMMGNITRRDERAGVHAHVIVGLADGTTRGGHLLEGHVWPTLELVITESPSHLARSLDPATGLALIDLDAERAQDRGSG